MFIFSILQIIHDEINDIFEKYHAMMKNLAYSILQDYQLAEDATQEALLSLSENMDGIDNIDSDRSKNFIYTITKNKSINLLKKESSKKCVQFFDEYKINNIPGDLDLNAFCNEFGFSEKVMEALSQLEELDKDIIIYKFGCGYSGREIAKLIDRTPDYVYKRLQRAIQRLQVIL